MANATAYTAGGGQKEAKVTLPKAVFGLEANHELLQLSYNASLAERRAVSAKTLLRGEVRGGGKKPWRQKGTGRARAGSKRSPLWRGGGVTFGPTGEANFRINLNAKARRLATAQALSAQAAEGRISIIEKLDTKDGKTKPARQVLDKLEAKGRILLVVEQKTDLIDRATRNLAAVETVSATYLNVRNVLDADQIVFDKAALAQTAAWLSGQKEESVSRNQKSGAKK